MSDDRLLKLARDVAGCLVRTDRQLVLAESCTAGLVAATLGAIPGISRHFCGSAVVYQEQTKTAWLKVGSPLLAEQGAVSGDVASAMATGVLAATPHADLGAAITGHLGPDAPEELDGQAYVAVQLRGHAAQIFSHRLTRTPPGALTPSDVRILRQREAAAILLGHLLDFSGDQQSLTRPQAGRIKKPSAGGEGDAWGAHVGE